MKVKICGLTSVADAVAAAEVGADWIGLNFHPPSPRFLTRASAREIVEALPRSVSPVGLFVNRPPAEVAEIARGVGLRIVQLHGDEPAEDLLALRAEGLTVVRAFRLADGAAVEAMEDWLRHARSLGASPDAVLVDAFVPGTRGGTGSSIPPRVLDRLARRLGGPKTDDGDADPPLPLILAGGLTPENVADRAARVHPWMVDVAGGVESAPGRKDPARMAAFLQAARS